MHFACTCHLKQAKVVCSMKHIPSFIEKSDSLRTDKSIDEIMCISVNDVFVMDAWGKVRSLVETEALSVRAVIAHERQNQ